MTKTYIDELVEEIAKLRDYYDKAITREREMATKFNNAYWKNQQLKEMLLKCREKLDKLDYGCEVWQGELTDFINEIDEVLK